MSVRKKRNKRGNKARYLSKKVSTVSTVPYQVGRIKVGRRQTASGEEKSEYKKSKNDKKKET